MRLRRTTGSLSLSPRRTNSVLRCPLFPALLARDWNSSRSLTTGASTTIWSSARHPSAHDVWIHPAKADLGQPLPKGRRDGIWLPRPIRDADATPRVLFTGPDGLTPFGVQDGKVGNGSQINITYHFSQGLPWFHGAHQFKTGWEIRRYKRRRILSTSRAVMDSMYSREPKLP